MILEFDAVDSSGFRFRYHGETFGTHDPLRDTLRVNELHIRYHVLFAQMDHVRRVLGMIDTYLYESHGMIAECEAEYAPRRNRGEPLRRDGVEPAARNHGLSACWFCRSRGNLSVGRTLRDRNFSLESPMRARMQSTTGHQSVHPHPKSDGRPHARWCCDDRSRSSLAQAFQTVPDCLQAQVWQRDMTRSRTHRSSELRPFPASTGRRG